MTNKEFLKMVRLETEVFALQERVKDLEEERDRLKARCAVADSILARAKNISCDFVGVGR